MRREAALVVDQVRVFEPLLRHAVVFFPAPLDQLVGGPRDDFILFLGALSVRFGLESALLQVLQLPLLSRGHVSVWRRDADLLAPVQGRPGLFELVLRDGGLLLEDLLQLELSLGQTGHTACFSSSSFSSLSFSLRAIFSAVDSRLLGKPLRAVKSRSPNSSSCFEFFLRRTDLLLLFE